MNLSVPVINRLITVPGEYATVQGHIVNTNRVSNQTIAWLSRQYNTSNCAYCVVDTGTTKKVYTADSTSEVYIANNYTVVFSNTYDCTWFRAK